MGILAYYASDAAWGIFAGLGWRGFLYADTILFFLSLVAFVVMWCRFTVDYLHLAKWQSRILSWAGLALLAFNVAALAANPYNKAFFYIDGDGVYRTGAVRDVAFCFLLVLLLLAAAFVLAKALASKDSPRRRGMMVFMSCITIATAIILQVAWPLTPFTALGCLISNCFLHVFVIQDEQSAKHMALLEKALSRARNAEKARSLFFSIVSHDIRTPLNAIIGYSELLQDGVKTKDERDEALKSIRASGTTLLQLVNDVLDLAKMDAGKLTLQPAPLRLDTLTDDVLASFRLAAATKGIELVNRTADVPPVLLDGHRIRQVLFNLIGNAVKFTDRGSVTVAASYEGETLDISVSDTGCGIPPDMLGHILEPFVQVQDASHTADRVIGTGLGLSICRRLVEIMGGELTAASELGKGSTFRAHIPGVAPDAAAAAPATAAKPVRILPENLPKHILVVDDSPVNRAVLTSHLKKAGIVAVDHAGDGEEAFEALVSAAKNGNPYDFVFSDFWMPNMNGLELIEKIRADGRFSRLPAYAVTADMEFHKDNRSELFTGIILKPLTFAHLVDAFATAANRAMSRKHTAKEKNAQ